MNGLKRADVYDEWAAGKFQLGGDGGSELVETAQAAVPFAASCIDCAGGSPGWCATGRWLGFDWKARGIRRM